jgi:hypothetical protein
MGWRDTLVEDALYVCDDVQAPLLIQRNLLVVVVVEWPAQEVSGAGQSEYVQPH